MIKTFINLPVISYNPVVFKSNPNTTAPLYAPKEDAFVSNPINEGLESAAHIEQLAKTNPRILELAQKYKFPIKVNEKELNKLRNGHLRETRLIVAKMYSALPEELKKEVNLKQIQDAAKYHDFGKILIPEKILNKADSLTDAEWEIMQLHSELGYELLKDTGLDKRTLEMIKYHHQNSEGTGYPALTSYYETGIDSQILKLADKYAALTEERSYKSAMSKEEALQLIAKEMLDGSVSEDVYNALVKAVN